jgi:hypothetical protein
MKNTIPNAASNVASNAISNAAEVWKQMEDVLVPQLRLSILDRSVYSHLLRHSRLEGKLRLRFSIQWLARAIRVSGGPAREAVRRLAALGALRLIERTKIGHLVEVRLPGEISAKSRPGRRITSIGRNSGAPDMPAPAFPSDDTDFLQTRALRQSIHSRERGLCFYCLRRLSPSQKCLDHVVPCPVRPQFLSQPRLLLRRVQLAKKRTPRPRLPSQSLPRPASNLRRTHRSPPRPQSPIRRQTPPSHRSGQ